MIWNHYPSVQKFQLFLFLFFCRNPVPQLGIKLCLPTVEAQSRNHWITREFPVSNFFIYFPHCLCLIQVFIFFFVLVSFSFLFYFPKLILASLDSCLLFEAYHEKWIKKAKPCTLVGMSWPPKMAVLLLSASPVFHQYPLSLHPAHLTDLPTYLPQP